MKTAPITDTERGIILRWAFSALLAWQIFRLVPGVAAPADPAQSAPAHNTQPIAWNELGAKATAQYSGNGLALSATANGANLRCVFQKLEGEATQEGLSLSSTAPGSSSTPFRVLATSVGRERGERRTLPSTGTVETSGGVARFIRSGLVEEYSVSVDGLRQDFVLPERLPGQGALRVELAVTGARVEMVGTPPCGVQSSQWDNPTSDAHLVLENSGRKINYHRLRATDATGRELAAWMEVLSSSHLTVMVEDGGAKYPVRIDPTFSDANWISMGGILGLLGGAGAVAVDGSGNLYVGGDFTIAGNVFATNIAKWNGSSWSALGSGLSGGLIDGEVLALAVSGSNLYAGGYFTNAGGIAASGIAKWDGSSWSALGSGMEGVDYPDVNALAVSGGDLYAGGYFTTAGGIAATNIAKWNGSSWSALDSGLNGSVEALAVSGSDLYAGGEFTAAGGIAATNIAKWNGSSWSALGSGMGAVNFPAHVTALAVSGTDLYAGGWFTTAGGIAATNIAKWNGSSWSALGSGINNDPSSAPVWALAVSGTDLYAGGHFTAVGGIAADYIAKWNGSSWSAVGARSGIGGGVNGLLVSGSSLYAVGGFTTLGGIAANNIAKWNGSSWSALGSGMGGFHEPFVPYVQALVVSGSDLYAGGYFTAVGGIAANNIAKWNGSSWSTLGSGMGVGISPLGPFFSSVNALAVSGNDLYAGGTFTTAGGVAATNIAKWNGSSWSALGPGINSVVEALAVSGNDLYAGGTFTTAGGVAATSIAKWNGSSWSALGPGISGVVWALAVSGNDLYAGGFFTTAGGIAAANIAKWNGTNWSALGSGMGGAVSPSFPPEVFALAVSGTDLYAGGYFTRAGGIAATNIAKWNGSSWSALGSGISAPFDYLYSGGAVSALAVSGIDLYVAGNFATADGIAANNIAKWNGSSWSALGSGISGSHHFPDYEGHVVALVASGTDLYSGGDFITAGDKVSSYLARARIGSVAKSIGASSGSALIQFCGVTGYQYDVQRATSLNLPITWTTVTTSALSPADDGSFTFTDTNAPADAAYYRAVHR